VVVVVVVCVEGGGFQGLRLELGVNLISMVSRSTTWR